MYNLLADIVSIMKKNLVLFLYVFMCLSYSNQLFSQKNDSLQTSSMIAGSTLKVDTTLKVKKEKTGEELSRHFVLFGHHSTKEGVKNHKLIHHHDSTHHHSLFSKYRDSLAYRKHHFKHLKKYHSGLLELKIRNADLREVFDDIIKETGVTFTYIGSVDIKSTLHIESFSIEQLVDEVCYQSGLVSVKEQGRFLIYGYGSEGIVKDDKIIYHYSPRNIGAKAILEKTESVDVKAEVSLLDEQNLLLLSGTLPEIKDAIYKLRVVDVEPKSVAIELLIVEYNHGNNFKWGFDVTSAQQGRISDLNYQPNSGFNFSYNFLGQLSPNFKFNLQALVDDNYANIVTNPHVTSLNNERATLEIKETRYILLQTSNLNGVTNTLQDISTGIELDITPVIMANDAIHLEVDINNSVFLPTETQGDINTLSNNLTTKVIARNGETLIIGGMIKVNESDGRGGVPFLRRIPIVGLLFKNKSMQEQYVETVIYITPYIDPLQIKEYKEAAKTGQKLQKELDKRAVRRERKGLRKMR